MPTKSASKTKINPMASPACPTTDLKKVAILFSGGPAPTANAVIGSVASCLTRAGIGVIGLKNGYTHLVDFDPKKPLEEGTHYIRLDQAPHTNEGLRTLQGIVIGTARANPGKLLKTHSDLGDATKTTAFRCVYDALRSLGVDALISLGGDDTLTTAAKFKLWMDTLGTGEKKIRVIHLPKTIDNDYEGIDFTFGYFTAVEMLAKQIRNLLADSEATSTGYICQLMGRKAAWLSYGAAIAGEASMVIALEDLEGGDASWRTTEETIDPETGGFIKGEDGQPFQRVVFDISKIVARAVDIIQQREREGRTSFVMVMSEGLAEYLPLSEIKMCVSEDEFKSLKPDTFGHFPVSQLKYSSRLGRLISDECKRRTGRATKMVGLQFGYEVRCNTPTAFDVILGSQIGVGAYRALCEKNLNGVMVSVGGLFNVTYPTFEELIDMSKLRAYARPVEIGSDFHQLARYLEAWTS